MDLYLTIHMAWLYTSTSYANYKLIVHLTLKHTNCNIVKINQFVATYDHGQIMANYHPIYFAYICPYRIQVATNVQLNYNYEIL
jgi:hypothetical protein